MGFLLCSVLVRDFYKDSRKLVCFVIYILLNISLFSCDNVKKSFFYYESIALNFLPTNFCANALKIIK